MELSDNEIFRGYAFRKDAPECQKYIYSRYEEIIESKPQMKLSKNPSFGRVSFRGELLCDKAKSLSSGDLLIWADSGNVCFGGRVVKEGDSFYGQYNTD